ncbi:MAG: hypothetical protein L0332_33035 [Chloroflexi bacterium]|nr:hypothetical protein [Chloroflexota bacterium]
MPTNDDLNRRLTGLRRAHESGALDEDTYRAAVAALAGEAGYTATTESGAVAQGAGSTAVGERGVQVGGNVGGSVITGDVYYGEPAQDPAEAIRIYGRVLAHSSGHLPLRGVDIGASDPTGGQQPLGLANVYVDLDTQTQVKKEEGGRKDAGRQRQLAPERMRPARWPPWKRPGNTAAWC